jgi:hypothetical protein
VACGVALVSCTPVREVQPNHTTSSLITPPQGREVEETGPATKPVLPTSAVIPPKTTRSVHSGIAFDGVAFDDRSHRLRVLDQSGGPGSLHPDAASAARSVNGLASVNGGFFTPEGEPLGRVIAAGKRSGSWNSTSSLGSGLWFADTAGYSAIRRRGTLQRADADTMRELLQAGPMLVENGRAVTGLHADKTSARTLILWDGGHRWWIGRTSPATLAQVAQQIASEPVSGWQVRHALNLDGGRSSDLWVSDKVAGGPLAVRPVWNRPVRNFLVLVDRTARMP